MAKHRMGRINEEMKKEMSNIILRELKDPRIKAMVSVTGVDVTTDLKYAKVYLSIFSPDKEEEKATLDAIKKASGFIRTRLSKTINLRNTPELIFLEDTSIDYGMHIDELLKKVIPAEVNPVETNDKNDSSESMDEE
ncbi:MAG: 30S ribosome-binding factor RbfA [Clostridiaceae bacterium]